jgi:hypothetical protein
MLKEASQNAELIDADTSFERNSACQATNRTPHTDQDAGKHSWKPFEDIVHKDMIDTERQCSTTRRNIK